MNNRALSVEEIQEVFEKLEIQNNKWEEYINAEYFNFRPVFNGITYDVPVTMSSSSLINNCID